MRTLTLFFGLLWRTFALQLIVSLAILTLIGVTGADVFHRDAKYILLKPTLIYGAFALALLIGWFGPRVNLVRAMWGKQGEFLYSANGDSTCDLLFRLQPEHTLTIEGRARHDGSQSGARFCPTPITLPFKP